LHDAKLRFVIIADIAVHVKAESPTMSVKNRVNKDKYGVIKCYRSIYGYWTCIVVIKTVQKSHKCWTCALQKVKSWSKYMGRVCSLLLSLLHTQGPYHKHINVTAYYRIITDRSKTLPQCPTITSFNHHAGIW